MGRRTWGPAAVALLGLLVAGCSDPEPRFADPTEPASPSASVSGTSIGSAKDTLVRWVDARNEALTNGDVTLASQLQTDDCTTCVDLLRPIEQIYVDGGQFETDGWKLSNIETRNSRVEADLLISGGVTTSSANAEPNRYPSEQRRLFAVMRQAGSEWRVARIGFIA